MTTAAAGALREDSESLRQPRPPPDSPDTYRTVLLSRSLAPEDVLPMPREELDLNVSAEETLVRLDLARPLPKAAWSGDLRADWWAMNRNLIPVVSLFCSNPLHPYSRAERLAVFIVEILWSIQVASWLGVAEACVLDCHDAIVCTGRRATGVCEVESEIAERALSGYCCSPPVLAARGCIRRLSVGSYSFGGMLFTSILNSVFIWLSGQLMKCACVQKKARSVRRRAELAGYVCFGLFGLLMSPTFVGSLYYLFQLGKISSALLNFFGGQVGSLAGVTAMNSAMFLALWRMQMPKRRGDPLVCLDDASGGERDTRNLVARLVNPRFCVSVCDHLAWSGGDAAASLSSSSSSLPPPSSCSSASTSSEASESRSLLR